ncbi:MAG: hypothetical protein U0T36_00110 [Saprospiraceae bacterium]
MNTNCSAGPTSNSAFTGQTGVQTDEFGGIYYENGKLMGYQVDRCRNFEINTIDGSLSLVSSNYPRDFRGDNAICKDCGDPTSNPGNTSEVTVCPDTTTTYTVTVTNEFGCKSTKEVTVVVNPLPTPLISGNSAICFGTSTILTVSGAGNYLWSTGETTSSISVSPTTTTTYQVTLTDGKGCKGSSSHTLAINPLPTPTVFGINEICLGSSTTIFATGWVHLMYGAMARPQRTSQLALVQRQNTA